MKRVTCLKIATLAIAAFTVGAPVLAQEAGEKVFDLYAGYYVPGIDDLDNDLTFGVDFGGRPAEQWGWNLAAGYLDLQQNDDQPLGSVIGDADGYFVDLSGIWYVGGSDFGIFAGVGFGTVDIDIIGTTEDASDDALTYNYGVNYAFNIGEKYVFKPEIKWRKWDGDTYEKTDEQYTLAFGWRF